MDWHGLSSPPRKFAEKFASACSDGDLFGFGTRILVPVTGVEVRGYEENKLSASCAAKVKFALYFGESDFSRLPFRINNA